MTGFDDLSLSCEILSKKVQKETIWSRMDLKLTCQVKLSDVKVRGNESPIKKILRQSDCLFFILNKMHIKSTKLIQRQKWRKSTKLCNFLGSPQFYFIFHHSKVSIFRKTQSLHLSFFQFNFDICELGPIKFIVGCLDNDKAMACRNLTLSGLILEPSLLSRWISISGNANAFEWIINNLNKPGSCTNL